MEKKKSGGNWPPKEKFTIYTKFILDYGLTFDEACVLSVYYWYTKYGTEQRCMLRSEQIWTFFGMSNKTFHKIKKKLLEEGWITTNAQRGKSLHDVWFKGFPNRKNDTH